MNHKILVLVEGALPDVGIPAGVVPTLWLPGISRADLRGREDTPRLLAPLVWLAVAGQLFGHVNGKDWSLRALLGAERGPLRLNFASDTTTVEALKRAAPRLINQPIAETRSTVFDADKLDRLLSDDLHGDMLDWIDGVLDGAAEPERFTAFAARSARDLGFDPRKQGRDDAASLLVSQKGAWGKTWQRFSKASTGFHGVVQRLEVKEPPADLLADPSAYSRANSDREDELRRELLKLAEFPNARAEAATQAAEAKHGLRRDSVWAARGRAPLAQALAHLATIAKAEFLTASGPNALANQYVGSGWKVDAAAISALCLVKTDGDRAAVNAAIRALYLPWLDRGALTLQNIAKLGGVDFAKPKPLSSQPAVLLFVDGLRFDLAAALRERLEAQQLKVALNWCWSGWPTVTATCKPLATAVASALLPGPADPQFRPLLPSGKPADSKGVNALMKEAGWAVATLPLGDEPLWAETATFDEDGHKLGTRLVDTIADGLDTVAAKILSYVRAGRSVRIVTDHGWLLMPGGFVKAELPAALAEPDGKRTRCALVKEGAETSLTYVPWTWNDAVRVAAAPGAGSFYCAYEYAHGGISPQECVLPVIDIAGAAATQTVKITETSWAQLRLTVRAEGAADVAVDLLGDDGVSMLNARRAISSEGKASFPVSDDHEGKSALVVLFADDGATRLAERRVIVGGAI